MRIAHFCRDDIYHYLYTFSILLFLTSKLYTRFMKNEKEATVNHDCSVLASMKS